MLARRGQLLNAGVDNGTAVQFCTVAFNDSHGFKDVCKLLPFWPLSPCFFLDFPSPHRGVAFFLLVASEAHSFSPHWCNGQLNFANHFAFRSISPVIARGTRAVQGDIRDKPPFAARLTAV